MDLSRQQQQAMEVVRRWINDTDRQQVCRVFGYAGTGKTTIAKLFADQVDGQVIFASFTGKAAHVLRQKGCKGAQTLHSLIYIPSSKSAARLRELQATYIQTADTANARDLDKLRGEIEAERENVKRPSFSINLESDLLKAKLLVVDEVSMVNEVMGEDLEGFDVPILVLGDPAQLPPVKGGGYFTNKKPDVLLTEIHRQASDSPVLALATDVREGRGLDDAASGMVVPYGTLDIRELSEFEQVLVGTHKKRKSINAKMREHFGFPPGLPVSGDRLICTRNDKETGLLNGSQWFVLDAYPADDDDQITLIIQSADDETELTVEAHAAPFRDEEVSPWLMRKAQCFDYAYAMTVHKSQGSQFDSVCLIDESHKFRSSSRAWLYTGITRAANRLTIIR